VVGVVALVVADGLPLPVAVPAGGQVDAQAGALGRSEEELALHLQFWLTLVCADDCIDALACRLERRDIVVGINLDKLL
jgi:hypothetical protein